VSYEDRISTFGHRHHNNFVFRDRHHFLINPIIWPSYCYPVYYGWGGHYSFHYAYPFYQRRYIFVSLGGFWPDYSCIRYYWYPTHYYWWYGYSPVAYEVPGDTYNYYTYNYYGEQPATTTYYNTDATGIRPVDSNTFADVREKLSREQKGPDAQTLADTLFDDGVKAFEQGSYADAAEKFAAAMELAPEDMILPFAYAQALFADGRYTEAANAIRSALLKSSPDKEGVYYPRGLYLDENTLDEQIDQLAKAAEALPNDSDLQLLLGYHWLGIGETEKSLGPLTKAKEDYKNFGAASTLLELAEKIKAGETQ
jgi:tetratricopeptide (TPR) repeat protein